MRDRVSSDIAKLLDLIHLKFRILRLPMFLGEKSLVSNAYKETVADLVLKDKTCENIASTIEVRIFCEVHSVNEPVQRATHLANLRDFQ